MSLNLNKVILAGRLTATPELKATQSGISVVSFSLAINRRVSGDAEKKADFITVIAWRQTAEMIARYFKKGSPICVVGSIGTRSWEDRRGGKRYATEVIADEVYFVESKADAGQNGVTPGMAFTQSEELPEDDDLPF